MTSYYVLRERPDEDEGLGEFVMFVPGPMTDWPWLARLRNAAERDEYRTEGEPDPGDFGQAMAYARWISGKTATTLDIYDNQGRYIVTVCGGSPYWYPRGERMHQVGSSGWCWDCFREGLGFVRHPVTAEEVAEGSLNALPIVHDAESHPACEACGGGYLRPAMMAAAMARYDAGEQNDPLDGGEYALAYVNHGPRCARLGKGPEHEATTGTAEFCVGCGGTCCTGDPEAGPCTCTEASRLAYFERH